MLGSIAVERRENGDGFLLPLSPSSSSFTRFNNCPLVLQIPLGTTYFVHFTYWFDELWRPRRRKLQYQGRRTRTSNAAIRQFATQFSYVRLQNSRYKTSAHNRNKEEPIHSQFWMEAGKEANCDCSIRQNSFNINFSARVILFIIFMCLPQKASSIGCFVCSSFNGSNSECEDTFNSTVTRGSRGSIANYQFPCWAWRKSRQGLFPADHCIKVNGYRTDFPQQTVTIRTCALDSGTLTADTEIVRISHCGHFKYEGHQYTGCVQACSTDGCNFSFSYTKALKFLCILFPAFVYFA